MTFYKERRYAMGKMDLAVKQMLQRKSIYADLMNGTIFHGRQQLTKEKLEWLPEESGIFYRNAKGKLKAVERRGDIRMRADGDIFSLILATEAENKVHYGMPVKNMLYEALEYTRQIQEIEKEHREKGDWKEGDEFLSGIQKEDRLIPVITIVLYTGNKEDWDGPKSLWEMFKISEKEECALRSYLPDYKVHLVNIKDINNPELFKTSLKPIFFMLRYRKDKEKLYQYIQDNKTEIQKMDDVEKTAAYMLLGEQKRIEQMLTESGEKERKVPDMCEAIDDLIKDGEERGEKRGIEKGLERGAELNCLKNIKSLIANLKLSPVQAMDALDIAEADRSRILETL